MVMTKQIIMYSWVGCPEFWKNFVTDHICSFSHLPTRQLRVDELNNILTKYHAVYSEVFPVLVTSSVPTSRILEFESEAYYNWFVLKWGSI